MECHGSQTGTEPDRGHGGRMTTRVAVVGLNRAGRDLWLQRLRAHRQYDVVAAVDPDPARRAGFRDDTGLPAFARVDALGIDRVDLAVVAEQAQVGCALLSRGIAVFAAAPACLTSAEADALAAAERRGGAMLLAGSAARYRGDVRELGRLVPKLGRVRHVDLAWVLAHGVPTAHGGALNDLGWHLLDVLEPIIGPFHAEQVLGVTSGGPHSGVEDTARGFAVTDQGVSIALRAGRSAHAARDLTSIRVDGSTGTATLRCTFGLGPGRQPATELTLTREGRTEKVAVATEPVGAEYERQLDELPLMLAEPRNRGTAIAEIRRIVRIVERFAEPTRGSAVLPADGSTVPTARG